MEIDETVPVGRSRWASTIKAGIAALAMVLAIEAPWVISDLCRDHWVAKPELPPVAAMVLK